MTMKEYLDQGPLLEQRIQYHTRRLEELRAAIYTITSSRLQADRVQISRNRDPGFVRALEGIEQMEARIAGEISLTEELKEQMGHMFHQLLRVEYQQMMIYRYLDGMRWEEISNLLHTSLSTLTRWHRTALSILQLPEHPISIRDSVPAAG